MKHCLPILAGLVLLAFGAGCAHVIDLKVPQEFRGQKVKEDPPGTYAPQLFQGPRSC